MFLWFFCLVLDNRFSLILGAEIDINIYEDPRCGVEEANTVFAIGDEELYFAICIYDNGIRTFERGFIYKESAPQDNSTF